MGCEHGWTDEVVTAVKNARGGMPSWQGIACPFCALTESKREAERTERNRDMWKEQVSTQAQEIEGLRDACQAVSDWYHKGGNRIEGAVLAKVIAALAAPAMESGDVETKEDAKK